MKEKEPDAATSGPTIEDAPDSNSAARDRARDWVLRFNDAKSQCAEMDLSCEEATLLMEAVVAEAIPLGLLTDAGQEARAFLKRRYPERRAAESAAGLRVVTADELVSMKLPPREFLLEPWLRVRDLALVHSWRGVGKSWVALGISAAISCGGEFLGWKSPKARKVLHVDGELPLETLQERLEMLRRGGLAAGPDLCFLAADLQERDIPDLARREGQAVIEDVLDAAELLVLDNISTLFRSGEENEAESWQAAQQWLLRLRRRGTAVLVLHHSGKNLTQRGNSKREDVLDTTIALRRPQDYTPDQGARFEVTFEKSRGLHGAAVATVEAWLRPDERGQPRFALRPAKAATKDRAVALAAEGLSVQEIADTLGRSKSHTHRVLARERREGRLP